MTTTISDHLIALSTALSQHLDTTHQVSGVSRAPQPFIMHFDLLSLKAKKSISQLLCRKNDTESTFSGVDRNLIERGTTPGPSPDKASVRPNTNDSPSSNESPSRRKGLVGSLKENKLRSINSLRSLRSPTKAKQPDLDASPCADVGAIRPLIRERY